MPRLDEEQEFKTALLRATTSIKDLTDLNTSRQILYNLHLFFHSRQFSTKTPIIFYVGKVLTDLITRNMLQFIQYRIFSIKRLISHLDCEQQSLFFARDSPHDL